MDNTQEIKQLILKNLEIAEGISAPDSGFSLNCLIIMLDKIFGTNQKLKEIVIQYTEKFPETYADVVSMAENPSCSCRKRVMEFFKRNTTLIKEFYNEILNIDDEIYNQNPETLSLIYDTQKSFLSKFQEKQEDETLSVESPKETPKYLEGLVFSIIDDPIAYGEFIKELRKDGHFYKGFNLIKEDKKLTFYFY